MRLYETNDKLWEPMKADCSKCSGLCCTALFFSKADGFPENKIAGVPCRNLQNDYRCNIHAVLEQRKMRGCIGYDCFGAGQQVTQMIYKGKSWSDIPEQKEEIFDVFTMVFQLQQIRYFLTEASLLTCAGAELKGVRQLIEENIQISNQQPQNILAVNIEAYRSAANLVLKQVCRLLQKELHSENKPCPRDFPGRSFRGCDMSGLDLSAKLLIAADFSECTCDGTIFLGADTRDTNFQGADLRGAVFLTQGQINAAKGSCSTRIPAHLDYPVTWK